MNGNNQTKADFCMPAPIHPDMLVEHRARATLHFHFSHSLHKQEKKDTNIYSDSDFLKKILN